MNIKKYATAALILLILISAVIRFYQIGRESFRGDEIQTGYFVRTGIGNIIKTSGLERSNPPLYWIILHGWAKMFGYRDAVLRIPSAFFSILAVWMMFLVGRRLFDPTAGLIAALLTAGSSFHLYFAQDARNYSLLLLLSLVSIWAFLLVIQKGRRWTFAVYGTASVLLAYTHIYGLFIIAAQALFFLLYWKKHRPLRRLYIATMLIVGATCIPLVWMLQEKTTSIIERGFWISRPTLETIIRIFSRYAGAMPGEAWIPILFSLFFLIGVIPSLRKPQDQSKTPVPESPQSKSPADINRGLVLLALCLSVPILVPFLLSLFMTPIIVIRYTIGASAAFYLLTAHGISRLRPKFFILIAVGVILAASFFNMKFYFTHPNKEQWREAAALLAENMQPEDTVLFHPEGTKKFIDYYDPVQVPTAYLPRKTRRKQIALVVERIAPAKGSLWLIMRRPRSSVIPDAILKRYGDKSLIMKKTLRAIQLYRFRMNPPSK